MRVQVGACSQWQGLRGPLYLESVRGQEISGVRLIRERSAGRSPRSTASSRRPGRRRGTSSRCRARTRRGPCPSSASFFSTSCVTVMMWQPIASAWTMFSSSRGLAQISSQLRVRRGCTSQRRRHDRDRVAPGVGDPAGEDRDEAGGAVGEPLGRPRRPARAVISAVTFSFTPCLPDRRTRSSRRLALRVGDRDLHVDVVAPRAIARAWRSISASRRRTPRTRSAGPGRRSSTSRRTPRSPRPRPCASASGWW